jgi:serine/threonine protein kinase
MSSDGQTGSASTPGGRRFQVVVEGFLEALRRGEEPSIASLAQAHPELAGDIEELFPTLLLVEKGLRLTREVGERRDPPLASLQDGEHRLGRLGAYRLLREVGRGGMGVVYLAEQEALGRQVALKVLPFHPLMDRRDLARFEQEARTAAHLQHPNIVPVYDVGEAGGVHYYAMQFIEGCGLHAVLAHVKRLSTSGPRPPGPSPGPPEGPVPLEETLALKLMDGLPADGPSSSRYFASVARVGRDVARALGYAHEQGVLHRDIKPSNLLLDGGGNTWVTDFGLAKAAWMPDLTQTGEIVGTLRYMAPERFDGRLDRRSDVYSLGITLYELLTLRPAFEETDRARFMKELLAGEPPRAREIDNKIPRALEGIVLKAMSKEPEGRYASGLDLAQDLECFLAGSPVSVSAAKGPRRRRSPRPLVLAAAALLLGALAYPFWKRLPPLASGGGRAETALRASRTIPVGSRPQFVVACDLDGDGIPDLLTANPGSGDVSAVRGAGGGAFHPATSIPAGKTPYCVAAADLEGDGGLDLAVTSRAEKAVSILLRAGKMSFRAPARIDLGEQVFFLAAADLDRDGRMDLAVTGGEKDLWILKNEGKAVFGKPLKLEVAKRPNGVVAGDLDGDGVPDLATTNLNKTPDNISVLLNRGNGSFAPATSLDAGQPAFCVGMADLDRDGRLDLFGPDPWNQVVWILWNKGDGAFEPAAKIGVGSPVQSTAAADLDGDGLPDLASVGGQDDLWVAKNRGGRSFAEPFHSNRGNRPSWIVAADLDGDGKPDLAITSYGSGELAVVLSRETEIGRR